MSVKKYLGDRRVNSSEEVEMAFVIGCLVHNRDFYHDEIFQLFPKLGNWVDVPTAFVANLLYFSEFLSCS